MRPINLKAQAVMDRLTAGITRENSHTRIDNNKPDSGIMAVVVEWVGDCKLGDTFSIAHYYRFAAEGSVTCSGDECRTLPKHLSVGRLKVT